jgi:hypothetical protein
VLAASLTFGFRALGSTEFSAPQAAKPTSISNPVLVFFKRLGTLIMLPLVSIVLIIFN